jgi:hypothetical protein
MIGIVRIPEPGDRNLYFFRNAPSPSGRPDELRDVLLELLVIGNPLGGTQSGIPIATVDPVAVPRLRVIWKGANPCGF